MWGSVDAACHDIVRVAAKVAPQALAVSELNSSYAAYRRMYPALKAVMGS
jgi:hypothetical protein